MDALRGWWLNKVSEGEHADSAPSRPSGIPLESRI